MTENLRTPTTETAQPVQPITSPAKMELVQDDSTTEGVQQAATEHEVEVPEIKRRKKRGRKKRAVKPKALALTSLELMSLDLNQARVDMQATVLDNLKMKERIINGEYAMQRDLLRKKQMDTAASMEKCKEDYNQIRQSIQKRLGLSLDDCTVRQDGVLIPIDKDGNPEYIGDDS